jgi:excisionase family DNA binding protein
MAKAKTPPRSNANLDDPLFNTEEAAAYLGVTKRWIRDRIAEGSIPRTKLKRLNRFRKSHLDKWIEEHTDTPGRGS